MFLVGMVGAAPAQSPPLPSVAMRSVRLRMAWGGGRPARWSGSVTLSAGRFTDYRWIGTTARGWPIRVSEQRLDIPAAQPSLYEALEVTVDSPVDASLNVSFVSDGDSAQPYTAQVPIAELLTATHNQPLDADDNRILIQKLPGDELRVSLARDHLVFSPGETWRIDVEPNGMEMSPGATARYHAQIVEQPSGKVRYRDAEDVVVGDDGTVPCQRGWELMVPRDEGVYNLELSIESVETYQIFRGGPRGRRIVQFVVVDNQPPPTSAGSDWRKLLEFDASQPRWWESLMRMPAWNRMPNTAHRVVSEGAARAAEHRGRVVNRLPAGKWQAYPLPITRVGVPHVLEVHCPADVDQSLTVCIVEPDGQSPQSLHGSAMQTKPFADRRTETIRVVFWPETRLPFVLLHNLADNVPVLYESIRVYQGPTSLVTQPRPLMPVNHRQAIAYVGRPDFHRAFSAPQSTQASTGQNLTDWVTFLNGGQRFVQYLRFAGYTGSAVGVWFDGGTILPATPWNASSRFDTGPYFDTGQDPVPKDVVEMLFRMHDRERMQFLPSIKFSAPLPQLETAESAPGNASGLRLQNREGKIYKPLTEVGTEWFYNPLDPRVQAAVVDVIRYVTQRYGHHESFAGICLELGPETFAQLPGLEWGLDPTTLERFARDAGVQLPTATEDQDRFLRSVLNGPLRPAWTAWRAKRMTEFYVAIHQAIREIRPEARLVLATGELLRAPAMAQYCQPTLRPRPKATQPLLEMGLDLESLSHHSGITITRPFADYPTAPLTQQAPSLELRASEDIDRAFRQYGMRSAHVFHFDRHVAQAQTAELQSIGSYVSGRLVTMPAGEHRRANLIHAVASQDADLILDGSALGSTTSVDQLQTPLQVFQQLPSAEFDDVRFEVESKLVKVRTAKQQNETLVYVVNDAPWPVTATMTLRAPFNCRMRPLAHGRSEWSVGKEGVRWRISLRPYDLHAAALTSSDVQFVSLAAELSASVPASLQSQLAELVVRVGQLKDPVPWIQVANASFEAEAAEGGIADWETAAPSVAIDRQTYRAGNGSMLLQSDGPVVWARSQPFPAPPSGRLAVEVWLRGHQRETPPLRLAVEGRLGDEPYYRYAEIAERRASLKLDEWSPVALHIDDLPSDELKYLQVRFDMMGKGQVWLDDVSVFGLSFTRNEHHELSRIVALADLQLREERLIECARTLSRFWPTFLLREQSSQPQLAVRGDPSKQEEPVRNAAGESKVDPASAMGRIRQVIPRITRH